jgi:hypothetical protein
MFILPFEVLFDEEADQVDGLLMFVYGALVSSLITTCSCARRSISEACVDILKPFFFNNTDIFFFNTDIYTVTLVNFHLRAKLCKKSQSKNLSKKIRKVNFCDRRSPIFIPPPQLTLLKALAHCAPDENFWRERNVWCFCN